MDRSTAQGFVTMHTIRITPQDVGQRAPTGHAISGQAEN